MGNKEQPDENSDPRLHMPHADEFIVSCWHELGLCSSGGYGLNSLTFQEVKAYSDLVVELTPFEATSIVKMSKAYVGEQSLASKDKSRETCLLEEDPELYREVVKHRKAEVISSKMRMFAQQGKN